MGLPVIVAILGILLALPAAALAANSEPLAAIEARYSARHNLYYDAGSNQIYWYHSLKGDCDQNGQVNISDITRLAAHLGKTIDAGNIDTAAAAADCDENGQVNISDLSAMGAHLDEQLTGYNVYWEYDFAPGYPLHSDDVNEDIVSWKTILDYEFDAVGDPGVDHLRYNIDVGAENAEKMWFWCQEELAGPVGRLSKMHMAHATPNTAINTFDPNWGLSYDSTTMTVSFYHTFRTDHNQNGEVNINDISPVGVYLLQEGPWSVPDPQWAVDSNRDGAIDLADGFLWSLFQNQDIADDATPGIGGFNLYGTTIDAITPPPHPIEPELQFGRVSADWPEADSSPRQMYTISLTPLQTLPGTKLWLRPQAASGELGARSEVITIP